MQIVEEVLQDAIERAAESNADEQEIYTELVEGVASNFDPALWDVYIKSTLPSMTLLFVPESISYTATSIGNIIDGVNATYFECVNKTLNAQIVDNMMNPLTNDTAEVSCGGTTWVSKMCKNGRTAMCLQCPDPCASACGDPLVMNPAAYSDCGEDAQAVFRLLNIEYEAAIQPPEILEKQTICTRTECTVDITTNEDGIVYCGIYPQGVMPSSTGAVINQHANDFTVGNATSITFTGLTSLTAYEIYCMSENTKGVEMGYLKMVQTGFTNGTTACCKEISVLNGRNSVYQFGSLVDVLTVSLGSLPTTSVTIEGYSTFMNASGNFTQPMVPASRTLTSSNALSDLLFSLSNENTRNVGQICLSIKLSGTDSDQYGVTYIDQMLISVLDLETPPPVPVATRAQFVNSGESMIVTFDTSTDRFSYATAYFACNLLFAFEGVNFATCRFINSIQVSVTLSSSAVIVPGGTVTLLGDKVRAECANANTTLCGLYAYADSVNMTLMNADQPETPVTQVTMPASIGLCLGFAIDLTTSLGSGGRAFTNITFVVDGTDSVENVTNWLHENYVFQPPSMIPAGLLNKGSFNFAVRLCTFLGKCSSSTQQLTVRDEKIPTAKIVGSTYREMYRSSRFVLKSEAFVEDCDGVITRTGINYVWSIYRTTTRQTVLITDIDNTALDPSFYILDPWTLSSDTLYEVKVSVIDTTNGNSASASMHVYTMINSIEAVISGGAARGIATLASLTLTGSASVDNDNEFSTGAAAGIEFEWECKQVCRYLCTHVHMCV
jgi:hypothetical protein